MITPCINVCVLEEGYCTGCKRSKEEILHWRSYTDEQRDIIMQKLEERK